MIIQIDHVALSSMNFEEDIKILEALNYELQFIKKGIRNLQIKRGLMKQFSKEHDLALLTSKGNIGIELLNHRHINTEKPYIFPIFENVPDDLTDMRGRKKINGSIFTEVKIKSIDAPIYIKKDSNVDGFGFNKIVIKVTDIRKTMDFWACLGFKAIQIKSGFALLEFRSLFSKDVYYIYLHESDDVNDTPYIDDNGFNCIAFISNSVKNEKDNLERNGIQTTKIEELSLNRKELNIFFAIGPCGELVEIVSMKIDKGGIR